MRITAKPQATEAVPQLSMAMAVAWGSKLIEIESRRWALRYRRVTSNDPATQATPGRANAFSSGSTSGTGNCRREPTRSTSGTANNA